MNFTYKQQSKYYKYKINEAALMNKRVPTTSKVLESNTDIT